MKNKWGKKPSMRMDTWDYRWEADYFITFCTDSRIPYFGEIKNGEMILSEIGRLAHSLWLEIPQHYKYVELGVHVIMPDHIHGIISLPKMPIVGDKICGSDRFQNPGKNSLITIVGSYKAAISKFARRMGYQFKWQQGFHDRIIRNEIELNNIVNYIINNPKNWGTKQLQL